MAKIIDAYPVTPVQAGMFFHSLSFPGDETYVVRTYFDIAEFDQETFEKSVRQIINEYAVLRTVFRSIDGKNLQCVLDRLDELPIKTTDEHIKFNLSEAPLFYFIISPEKKRIAFVFHHIILDGWSQSIVLDRLLEIYNSLSNDIKTEPPYKNYILWMYNQNENVAKNFWKKYLSEAKNEKLLELDSSKKSKFYEFFVEFSDEETKSLKQFSKNNQITLSTLFLGTVFHVLMRYFNKQELIVGTVTSGRHHCVDGIDSMVGMLINTVPIYAKLDFSSPMKFLKNLQTNVQQASQYDYISLNEIMSECFGFSGNFDVLFAYENFPRHNGFDGGEEKTEYPLNIAVMDFGNSLKLRFGYMGINDEHVLNISKCVKNTLFHLVATENYPQNLLPSEETFSVDTPDNCTVLDIINNVTNECPDSVAVSIGSKHLTYAQLNEMSNAFANHLIDQGLSIGDVVGIYTNRSIEMIIGILGIVKSGAAYMPIDISYPAERVEYMLKDSGAKMCVCNGLYDTNQCNIKCKFSLAAQQYLPDFVPLGDSSCNTGQGSEPERIGSYSEVLNSALYWFMPGSKTTDSRNSNSSTGYPAQRNFADTVVPLDKENTAYVIYTSGSTGKPKGAGVTHAGLKNIVTVSRKLFHLSSNDRIFQFSSIGFDVSVWEIFTALTLGANLVLACKNGDIERVKSCEVTVVLMPTSVLKIADFRDTVLRVLLSGGEAFSKSVMDKHSSIPFIFNVYGPTEASIIVSTKRYMQKETSIGKAVSGIKLYVLGESLDILPVGVIGEIHIGGVGVAQGYVNRPKLTAERFIADPFGDGDRLYKTGDLGRYLPNGDIEYVGRIDNQVKIRGYRIELSEIEAAISRCSNVRNCIVLEKNGHLVAYVATPASNFKAIKSEIEKYLPSYMIPNYFVSVDVMPLTYNGKVDTKALLSLKESVDLSEKYVAPRNEIEEKVCRVLQEILKIEKVGIDDDFFLLGLDSISAIQLMSKAKKEKILLSIKDIFEKPSVRKLVGSGMQQKDDDEEFQYVPQPFELISVRRDDLKRAVGNVELVDAYPLSPLQHGFLFRSDYEKSDDYFIQYVIHFDYINSEALREAWEFVINQYDVLRTGISMRYNLAFVLKKGSFEYSITEQNLEEFIVVDRQRRIDLRMPPLRVTLVKAQNRYAMVWSFHHIILDGWSSAIVLKNVLEIYEQIARERQPKLSHLPPPYKNYIAWLTVQNKDTAKEFWKNYLANIESNTMFSFAEIVEKSPQDYATDEYKIISADVEKFCKNNSITVGTLLLGTIAIVLGRFLRQNEIVLGTVNSGREINLPDIENMVGMFINTIPVRIKIPSGSLLDYFTELQRNVRKLGEYSYISVAELLKSAGYRSDLFSVLFAYDNYPIENDGYAVEKMEYPLSITAYSLDGNLHIRFSYQTRHFDKTIVKVLFESISSVLESILVNDRISELQAVSHEERLKLLGCCDPEIEIPPFSRLEKIFADKADAIAISFGSRHLTYEKLDDFSSYISDVLRDNGIGADDIVGVYTDRSIELIIALFGVMKSGAAYLPLDPDYPEDRLNYMLQDSDAKMCICTDNVFNLCGLCKSDAWSNVSLREQYSSACKFTRLRRHIRADFGIRFLLRKGFLAERNFAYSYLQPPTAQAKENLAYIIYTSGSTGKPKGVLITYKNIMNLFAVADQKFDFSSDDVWMMFHNFSFDVSVWEWLGALYHGAHLVLVDKETAKDSVRLEKLISRNLVTVLTQTPRVLYNLSPCELRYVITCGDKLDFEKIAGWNNAKTKIVNMYGITETTVHTTYYEVEGVEKVSNVGHPLPNYGLYILDDNLNLQPRCAIGEICVSGFGLARGYLNRPELTAEKFVANPFGDGDRLYRSGDLGRYLPDGNIEYIGRIDNQVKVRGYRIELSEIEFAINLCFAAAACAVLLKDQRIIAYVVSKDKNYEVIKQEISKYLPNYMVPHDFVFVDELPLTVNGKLDKKALLSLDSTTDFSDKYVAPKNVMEKKLCEIWQKVLGVEKVGIDDSFFQLGGDSISAMQINLRLKNEKLSLRIKDLFEEKTIRNIAKKITKPDEQEVVFTDSIDANSEIENILRNIL